MPEGESGERSQISSVREPDWSWYDLAAEERLKRRFYFVAVPVTMVMASAGAVATARLFGPGAVFPVYLVLCSPLFAFAMELVPSPSAQSGSVTTRVLRRTVRVAIGAVIYVFVLAQLGLLPDA